MSVDSESLQAHSFSEQQQKQQQQQQREGADNRDSTTGTRTTTTTSLSLGVHPPQEQQRTTTQHLNSHQDCMLRLEMTSSSLHDREEHYEKRRIAECEAVAVQEEEREAFAQGDQKNENDDNIPCVVATPLQQAFVCMPAYCDSPSAITAEQQVDNGTSESRSKSGIQTDGRPEFIFASTVIPKAHADGTGAFGIVLENAAHDKQGGVIVAKIQDDSPFQDTHIKPGDTIVAVNGLSCARSTLQRVTALMQASVNKIAICVHNPHGDSTTVSSSVIKPQPNAKIGITLSRSNDTMRIKDMTPDSLFADTLLLAHQRCVAINGIPCECLSATTASHILASSNTKRVTIVSKVQRSRAITLAVDQRSTWWRKVACKMGLNQQAVPCTETLWEGPSCHVHRNETAQETY